MAVSVTVNDEAAQALLQRLATLVANPSAPLRASAQTLRRLVIDTFQDQTDPWGKLWKAWAPSTRAARRKTSGGAILLRTFAMFRSVEAEATTDGVSVTVGTDYATYHQFGNPKHRPWGRVTPSPLPQRAFLPLRAPGVADIPANWWTEILFPVEAAIGRAAQ